ncbi:MAG: hypothetical protein ABWY25_07360 [Paenisporosarcina sp.]
MNQTVKEFIEHHGVKGMRWGVRKKRNDSAFRDRNRTTYGKSPKKLSSAELEKRIRRMEAEKRYNDLNKRDVSKGEQIAAEILTNSGKKVATTVLTGAGILAIKAVAKKKGLDVGSIAELTKRK